MEPTPSESLLGFMATELLQRVGDVPQDSTPSANGVSGERPLLVVGFDAIAMTFVIEHVNAASGGVNGLNFFGQFDFFDAVKIHETHCRELSWAELRIKVWGG